MTNNNHPIRPPHELVQHWVSLACENEGYETWQDLATQAARYGADQELEACCEILRGEFNYHHLAEPLRAARRPKPPSLKDEVKQIIDCLVEGDCLNDEDETTLRRALEQLND